MGEPDKTIDYLSNPQKWFYRVAVPLKRNVNNQNDHAVAFLSDDQTTDKPLVLVEDSNVFITTIDGLMTSPEGDRRIREDGVQLTPDEIAKRGWRVD